MPHFSEGELCFQQCLTDALRHRQAGDRLAVEAIARGRGAVPVARLTRVRPFVDGEELAFERALQPPIVVSCA